MSTDLFTGQLVRLGSDDPQILGEAFSRWHRNADFFRLLNTEAARLLSAKKLKGWFEEEPKAGVPDHFLFTIHTLAEDKLIGFISFEEVDWANRDTYVAIGIGEQEYWGKGYGTDAMRLMLRYGFSELNLHRVSLTVFEYNPRGIRSYEKCGFRHEGRIREFILRDGKRWDMLHMGILRADWQRLEQERLERKT